MKWFLGAVGLLIVALVFQLGLLAYAMYALLGVIIGLCVVFPGFIAHAIDPTIQDPNQVYPFLVMNVLPPSLRGVILAALVGAVMSTVSSLVNSTAMTPVVESSFPFHFTKPRRNCKRQTKLSFDFAISATCSWRWSA